METNGSYYTIQDWMLAFDLDLTETAIFAIIHSFSKDGESRYRGSRQYLADQCKCSTDKVDKSLKKLRDLGLVYKNEIFSNGVKFCEYQTAAGSRYGRLVAAPSGRGGAATSGGGSRSERHNNIEYNGDTIVSPNKENNAQSAQPRPFDFKKALLEMGVSEQHASDWMAVRKAKRMTNTRTAFDRLKAHIERACKQYTVTPDDCVAFAASKDWGGFDSSWEAIKEITKNNTLNEDDRVRRAYAAAEAKFKGDLHF